MSPRDDDRAPGRNPPLPQPDDALPEDKDARNPNGGPTPPAIPAEPKTTRFDVGGTDGQSPHTADLDS